MCIKRSRAKADNVFRDYIKNLIDQVRFPRPIHSRASFKLHTLRTQEHVTVLEAERESIFAWLHQNVRPNPNPVALALVTQ